MFEIKPKQITVDSIIGMTEKMVTANNNINTKRSTSEVLKKKEIKKNNKEIKRLVFSSPEGIQWLGD